MRRSFTWVHTERTELGLCVSQNEEELGLDSHRRGLSSTWADTARIESLALVPTEGSALGLDSAGTWACIPYEGHHHLLPSPGGQV